MSSNKKAKKIARKAQATYFKTCACSLTQLKPFQDAFNIPDDDILKAAVGLSGGMFSKGSTCGVVFSGALTLAMLMDKQLSEWKPSDEAVLHAKIKDFATWFREQYGTTLCKERTNLNLWTKSGLLGLFLPSKLSTCLSHTGGTSKYLFENKDNVPEVQVPSDSINSFHCAKQVLEKIRENTGVGNGIVERISIALDGGLGLQGDACGAIAGAVMAISLKLAKNMRESNMLSNMGSFLSSPRKLRKQKSHDDFFSVGGKLMDSITEITDFLECRNIINKNFENWEDFQQFGTSKGSTKCREIIDFVSTKTSELLSDL
jgi:hypothetical protein